MSIAPDCLRCSFDDTADMKHRPRRTRAPRLPSAVQPSPPKLPFDPDRIDLQSYVEYWGLWTFTVDPALAYGSVWVDRIRHLIVVNPEFWTMVEEHEEARDQFGRDVMAESMPAGMSSIPLDRGVYADAQRQHAAAQGTDVVMAKDAITQLTEQAEALVLAATGMRNPTPGQLELFITQQMDLQTQLQEQERRLEQLRQMVALAGLAVMEL